MSKSSSFQRWPAPLAGPVGGQDRQHEDQEAGQLQAERDGVSDCPSDFLHVGGGDVVIRGGSHEHQQAPHDLSGCGHVKEDVSCVEEEGSTTELLPGPGQGV